MTERSGAERAKRSYFSKNRFKREASLFLALLRSVNFCENKAGNKLVCFPEQVYPNFNFRGIHDEKKMFFRRTIVIRYVLNHIALFICAFLVAIFALEFGLAMSQNITFHDIMKDTGTWFSEFFLQHLDDHILIIFDSIAIVSLSWFHNFVLFWIELFWTCGFLVHRHHFMICLGFHCVMDSRSWAYGVRELEARGLAAIFHLSDTTV